MQNISSNFHRYLFNDIAWDDRFATHQLLSHLQKKVLAFSNGINMEYISEMITTGKLIHKTDYPQRTEKYTEIEIDGSKIDFYDAKNKVIHEIKKSDKMEQAHEWQVKYYILLLEENDVAGVKRILENPKLRETKEVLLEESYKLYLEAVKHQIIEIVISEN